MIEVGSPSVESRESVAPNLVPGPPLWFLAEVTYRCPLRCVYCSNPVNHADSFGKELPTSTWRRVLREARALGAVQLGFSGGEPLLRRDLEALVEEGRELGFYTNLITSGIGLDDTRLQALKSAGLDHIQLSFQANTASLNDALGGARSFDKKRAAARRIKDHGYPMVLNVVLHRLNIDALASILDFAAELEADYVELANVQFDGWAFANRKALLPTKVQVDRALATAAAYKERYAGKMKLYYVLPDYYETRPKACAAGWGRTLMVVTPEGTVLPCHGARKLPGMEAAPNVTETSLEDAWVRSEVFNRFRGDAWMKQPCRSCPEKTRDFGGCRCQAFLLTGDAAATDPVCALSPRRALVDDVVDDVNATGHGKNLAGNVLTYRGGSQFFL